MKKFKNRFHILLIFIVYLFLFSFLLTFLNQIHFLHSNATENIIFVFMIVFFSIIGFIYGKKTPSKGYLEGLKIGGIYIFFLIFINLIFFQNRFSIHRIIYYCVLILSSTLGSMIGINKKH